MSLQMTGNSHMRQLCYDIIHTLLTDISLNPGNGGKRAKLTKANRKMIGG